MSDTTTSWIAERPAANNFAGLFTTPVFSVIAGEEGVAWNLRADHAGQN